MDRNIESMVGETFVSVKEVSQACNDELVFTTADGRSYIFYHEQDCCENVYLDDVCGDLSDLEGQPLLEASERDDYDGRASEDTYGNESETWTFYVFSTIKGSVTVRWYGSSNGYYSEEVNLRYEEK